MALHSIYCFMMLICMGLYCALELSGYVWQIGGIFKALSVVKTYFHDNSC